MEFSELVQNRRSVRKYLPGKTVTQEQIEELLRCAQQAPTWKNTETGRYYVVMSPEGLKRVSSACLPEFNQNSSSNSCALIVTTFVKDTSGYTNGQPDNELENGWGAYDLGLQNAYLLLKATELGMDTLVMGIRDGDALRRELDIPAEETVVSVIALGYRDGEPMLRHRKEIAKIVKYF